MPLCRTLLALLLCTLAVSGADLRTLKGETISGDLESVSGKEIVISKEGTKRTVPVPEVLLVDLKPAEKPPTDSKYIDVELIDGTLLHCSTFAIKGKEVHLTVLVTGQTVKLPLASLANVLTNAQDEKNRKEWTARVAKKSPRDVLAVLRDGVVNPLSGTLGEGDADGKTISFSLGTGQQRSVPVSNIHGLIFTRSIDPLATPAVFKLIDGFQSLVLVSNVESTPAGVTVTTPSGAKLEFTYAQVARMDYSTGKLTFLSDMDPIRVTQTSTEELVHQYRRDRNLDETGPIKIKNVTYPKGLALHAFTELEYDLGGDYREFKCLVGIDDTVGGIDGPTHLKIEGDGKELFSLTVNRKDKVQGQPVTLNIKDVVKLRITVSSGDLLDLGKHLDLADAKVSK